MEAAVSGGHAQVVALQQKLGSPVVPFGPFYLGFSLLKPNIRKKGTLMIKGSLGNLGSMQSRFRVARLQRVAGHGYGDVHDPNEASILSFRSGGTV